MKQDMSAGREGILTAKLKTLLSNYLAPLFPDEMFIHLKSKLYCGYRFNLSHPRTFNEKMNWLKLHDRRPVYTEMADKIAAKDYVSRLVGGEYVVPLLGVWDSPEDIDFSALPQKCMLKANFDSGSNAVYHRGMDEDAVRQKIRGRKNLFNYYYRAREWPYKDVRHRFFAEELLDNDGKVIHDYKFWCFNGKPVFMYVTCKSNDIFENFYDMDFNPVPIGHGFPRRQPEFVRPASFDKMKEIASKLSEGIPFIRIDFMLVKGRLYFGEFTFYDWAGFRSFSEDWDMKIGEMLTLPEIR